MAYSKEQGDVLPYEVDDLTHYVFHNYSALMTVAEKAAYKALILERKGHHSSSEDMKGLLRVHSGSRDSDVVTLLAKGAREFLVATRDRILRDHGGQVFLNRCPKCGALARTPRACLCPSCNHSWYEKRRG